MSEPAPPSQPSQPHQPPIRVVGLFVPCLVDQLLPEVGVATVRVLRHLGLEVRYEPRQTCCGQPAHNAGHARHAERLAGRALRLFAGQVADGVDAVVAPSGSCVSMLRQHAPGLLRRPRDGAAWNVVAPRLFELTELLAGALGLSALPGRYPRRVAYHPSCHLARELGVTAAPTRLLASLAGITLLPLPDADICCGFGGTFSAKQPELSIAMGRAKAAALVASGAEELVMGDAGCLLQVRGVLAGQGPGALRARHVAEVLADALDAAAALAPAPPRPAPPRPAPPPDAAP
jgi:L-lactate dehydrogenase complex protein LldE